MKKNLTFVINCEYGSINDNIKAVLKSENLHFHYTKKGDLIAYINDEWYRFKSSHLNGNLYKIIAVKTKNIL